MLRASSLVVDDCFLLVRLTRMATLGISYDFQFRVRVSGGAEAILHNANRVSSQRHGDGSLIVITIDFSNAFNLLDMLALLRKVRVRCLSISI